MGSMAAEMVSCFVIRCFFSLAMHVVSTRVPVGGVVQMVTNQLTISCNLGFFLSNKGRRRGFRRPDPPAQMTAGWYVDMFMLLKSCFRRQARQSESPSLGTLG